MPKKQQSPESKAALAMSIAFKMLALALDMPDKTFGLRYPDSGTLRSVYIRFIELVGEREKWNALEKVGLMLIIDEIGKPQAVKVSPPAKKEPMLFRWQNEID